MLTARDEEPDRIVGLEVGADDYITKPFSPRELVARMKAVLRRTEPQERRDTYELGDVQLDRESHDVTVAGKPVELTAKEFDLLAYFMANAGVLVSRDLLLDRVWGQEYPGGTRTVDVHVAQLRRKLGRPDLIRTLRGAGYKAVALMRTLRARLFAATLAALALTLVLTIAIGAVLTRRQVDKSQATSLARRADDLQLQRRRSPTLHQPGLRLGQRAHHRPAARTPARSACRTSRARATARRRSRDSATSTRTGRCLARAPAAPVGEPALLRVAAVPARPAAGRRSSASRSPPGSRSSSPARSSRPIRRVAAAPRTLTLEDRPAPLPEAGTTEIASLARAFNEMAAGARRLARRRARIPALRQPRAEDAADGDPRLRRGAGRRRVRRRRGGAHDRARGRPARAARPRPARPRADEPQRVLDQHRSPSTWRRSRARPCSGTRSRRATSRSP